MRIIGLLLLLALLTGILVSLDPTVSGRLVVTRAFPGTIHVTTIFQGGENYKVISEIGYGSVAYGIYRAGSNKTGYYLFVYNMTTRSIDREIVVSTSEASISSDEIHFYSSPGTDALLVRIAPLSKTIIILYASSEPDIRVEDYRIRDVHIINGGIIVETSDQGILFLRGDSMLTLPLSENIIVYDGVVIDDKLVVLYYDRGVGHYFVDTIDIRGTPTILSHLDLGSYSASPNSRIYIGQSLVIALENMVLIGEIDHNSSELVTRIKTSGEINPGGEILTQPILVDNYIMVPTYQNGTVYLAIYDVDLNLLALKPVLEINGVFKTSFYSGLKGRYAILSITDSKNIYVFTYSPRGELALAIKLDSKTTYYFKPVLGGSVFVYLNKTSSKGKGGTNYYLYVVSVDGRYAYLAGNIVPSSLRIVEFSNSLSLSFVVKGEARTAIPLPKEAYATLILRNTAVLIPYGLKVSVYVTDRLGRQFIYNDIVSGQPVTVPLGRLSVKIVSREGYMGSEDNYEPISLAVEPSDCVEIDAKKYNAEVLIDGPYAEIIFIPESSGASFILVHYGGVSTYYLPPGTYRIKVRFNYGVVGEGMIYLVTGSINQISLEDFQPGKSWLDILIDNILPIALIVITIGVVIVVIIAIFTIKTVPLE